jgi:hypothetical protein
MCLEIPNISPHRNVYSPNKASKEFQRIIMAPLALLLACDAHTHSVSHDMNKPKAILQWGCVSVGLSQNWWVVVVATLNWAPPPTQGKRILFS